MKGNLQASAEYHLMAAASFMKMFLKGIKCQERILYQLRRVVAMNQGEISGDARMILAAIQKITGSEPEIPDVAVSHHGEMLKRAIQGEHVTFHPANDIESLIHMLVQNLPPQ